MNKKQSHTLLPLLHKEDLAAFLQANLFLTTYPQDMLELCPPNPFLVLSRVAERLENRQIKKKIEESIVQGCDSFGKNCYRVAENATIIWMISPDPEYDIAKRIWAKCDDNDVHLHPGADMLLIMQLSLKKGYMFPNREAWIDEKNLEHADLNNYYLFK